jgi:AGCS family alanine or glycine:cation symporter
MLEAFLWASLPPSPPSPEHPVRLRNAVIAAFLLCVAPALPMAADLSTLHAQEAAIQAAPEQTIAPAGTPQLPTVPERAPNFMDRADAAMGTVNGIVGSVLFYDVFFWDNDQEQQQTIPFIVIWLVVGSVFLTLRMGFINLRAFGHAINVTRGKFTDPNSPGEVSHFAALSTALSATVGLGNIAGVAIAVSLGGPGATFWMIVAGLFGMTAKFTECTLGQMYREVRPNGSVLGGGMQYLSKGLAERGLAGPGKVLAVMFAILCVGGSLGGGNSFQVNQSLNALQETVPVLGQYPWAYGLLMTVLVGVVIVGGVKRIASVADKIVPTMVFVYVAAALFVIVSNAAAVPAAFATIFAQAFAPDAVYGGFIGTLVIGFQRAAFSNEAGAGSAAIAHSAAKTDYPVREGIVALLEPFIDTVVVCTMTALVIVISGAYNNPAYADVIASKAGAALTSRAFAETLSWFPYVLSVAVFLFAYSTMISWSYYGERCWVWMFGDAASKYYKALFLLFVFLGSIITSTNVLDFGDLMILGMAFPNLAGVYILSGKVKGALDEYMTNLKTGKLKQYT